MHKDFVPPVSIEEFAAYLDQNLPDEGMQVIDDIVNQDESLCQLVNISKEIDMAMAEWQQEESFFDTDSQCFELPQIESLYTSGNDLWNTAFGGVTDADTYFVNDGDSDTDSQFHANQDDVINNDDDSCEFDDDMSTLDDSSFQ